MISSIEPAISESSPPIAGDVRVSSLSQRLDEGYERIEQAIQRGDDVTRWEAFWIDLLHEYEALQDELATAA